ncbi:hypothetical protein QT06_C0001G0266 [archaeon GW2011_AR15]|nr:hypothetical protein QT06_C0001G0266 [archaeon GW2011_AR15]
MVEQRADWIFWILLFISVAMVFFLMAAPPEIRAALLQ